MSTNGRLYLNRQQTKTSEKFIFELLYSYELSPKVSEPILHSEKEILLRETKKYHA